MPFDLQEEIDGLQDVASINISHEHDVSSMDAHAVDELLSSAVEAVAESSEQITNNDTFDVYRSLLKHSESLPGSVMNKILDSISSGLATQVDATQNDIDTGADDQQTLSRHKRAIEMYAYLLQWFVTAAEKVKTAGDDDAPAPTQTKGKRGKGKTAASRKSRAAWTWENQIPHTLTLISKVLRMSTQRIWTTTAERDVFINCLTRPAYHITENEQYMKSQAIKLGVYKVVCLAVKHHGHALSAQINIMQSLQYYEHLSEPLAELLMVLAKEFDHTQLGDEVLREIAKKTFSATDTKGPRAFSRFLVRLAELSPRSVLKQMSLFLEHQLDSESYPMRIALIEVMGFLIKELANPELEADAAQAQKQLESFYALLLDRTLDLNSYVRAKVFQVAARLCDLSVKMPKQRLAATRAAVDALRDKASTVRKASIVLLVRLLVTHPYGMIHGGPLGLEVWEKGYKEVSDELTKMEEAIGKAVERTDERNENDEGSNTADGGSDSEAPKKKKKKQRNAPDDGEMAEDEDENDNSMDVDAEEHATSDIENDEEGEHQVGGKKKGKGGLKPRKSELDLAALNDEQAALAALDGNKLLHLRLRKKYYAEALNFIRTIDGGMDVIGELLGSTNKLEVLEAIEFFRVAHEYEMDSAETGLKQILHLVWQKDVNATSEDGKEVKGVRARALECYRNIYFDPLPDLEPRQQVNRITKNLIELTYDATLAELTSLEEMLRSMMDEGQIHQDVISRLWQVYSSDKPLPKAQRRGAIIVIGMLALAKREVITDRVDTCLRIGLGSYGKADLTLARYTCVGLQRLNGSAKKVKGSLLDKTLRIEMESPIFRKLQDMVEHPCRTKDWFGLAEQAINTVYALGDHPDVFCDSLIKNLTHRAFASKAPQPAGVPADPDAMDEDPGDVPGSSGNKSVTDDTDARGKDTGDAFELSQLLFVVGHVSIKQIVFLELVEREWKRQKDEKTNAEKKTATATDAPATADKDGEELEQVVGNAEDEIGDRIAAVRESELLYGPDSLLAIFGPMVVHICGSPHKFKNRTLRAAATLTFSKFLCVSSQFCDQHHRLLFKILETSRDASIRSNAVIALGDIAVSFGTIVDENSHELYKGLSDEDLMVKKNTLMVLTHLILNGMIKVKGQLGEMAKCLEDPEERIADLAKLFFKELSTKENAIYNNLPDVISHLSVGEHAVDEESFQSTMRYIFSFIEKEKQAENITEKLCQRFRLSEDPRQWRDIAFCLSLLPFKSDRSMKKLIDGLQYYRDKLHEPVVFDRFGEILEKARSQKSKDKPDAELDEFQKILDEHRQQGEDDQALEKRAAGKKRKAARKQAATAPAQRRSTRKQQEVVQDDLYESD